MLVITCNSRFVAKLDLDHHYTGLFKPCGQRQWVVPASTAIQPKAPGATEEANEFVSVRLRQSCPDCVFLNV